VSGPVDGSRPIRLVFDTSAIIAFTVDPSTSVSCSPSSTTSTPPSHFRWPAWWTPCRRWRTSTDWSCSSRTAPPPSKPMNRVCGRPLPQPARSSGARADAAAAALAAIDHNVDVPTRTPLIYSGLDAGGLVIAIEE
jgi:hypothetical protein